MLTIIRISPRGLEFTLTEINANQTLVLDERGNSATINMPIAEMSRKWYKWQMRSLPIQEVFRELSADQREFLLTGITPEQWNAIFEDEEE